MKPAKRTGAESNHLGPRAPPRRAATYPPLSAAAAAAAAAADSDPDGCISMRAAMAEVERLLCYSFHNRGLLEEALTHSSSESSAASYQRLEFVGDAALALAFTNYLYLTNPGLGPGNLSALRAANISTEKLARIAVRHRLYRLLSRNCPRLDHLVSEFIESVLQEPEDIGGLPFGGTTMKAPKVLADIVESIAAAVYIDCNFNLEMLWKVIRGMMEPIITAETLNEQPVTMLHELCQKHGKTALFKNWQKGNVTIFNVFVSGMLVGSGSSEQKVIAKLNAARSALQKLAASDSVLLMSDTDSEDEAGEQECKQKLNELCSKKRWPKPIYKVEKEDGPAHERKFICSVQVETSDDNFITIGDPRSRVKNAENSAAAKMLSEVIGGI